MSQNEQARDAFDRIINLGRTAEIRNTAKAYWTAHTSDAGATEENGLNFEKAIRNIPLDYRQPTVKYLEDLDNCKANCSNDDIASCYLDFAVAIVDRIVKLS